MALKCRPLKVRVGPCGSVRPAEKKADSFYSTPEFKQWRTLVIRRAGNVCQWPGCTRSERRMFADHIVEIKDGGAPLDPANGQCLCGSHHSLKTIEERRKRAGIQR